MAKRKKLPDVMGELLAGNTDSSVGQKDSIPVNQYTGITANQYIDEKVKATYYISQGTIDALEEAKLQIRRLARKDKRQISNSSIVDVALQIAFADLEEAGATSKIASLLVNQ